MAAKKQSDPVEPEAPKLTGRIGAIFDAVQREADNILEQARAQAQLDSTEDPLERALIERRRRLLEISDALIARSEQVLSTLERVDAVRASFGRLADGLAEAAAELSRELESERMRPPSPTVSRPAGEPAAAAPEARQAAVQMAAAGCTRAQVEVQLRDFFGLADPTALTDQVFGAGTRAETRVPWAISP